MKRFGAASVATLAVLFAVLPAGADVPALVSYQGVLTDSLGVELDGYFDLTFRLYDVPAGGAAALWTETQSVDISDGLFNVYLGELIALDPSVFTSASLYLGITVEPDQEMTPRLRMASVPYAILAGGLGCLPQTEVCNGVDDDCDGETDEDVDCDDGNPCTIDVCVDGECQHIGEPEVCNGIDDDCDGMTDEDVVDCDDAVSCTDDFCIDAHCVHVPVSGMCFIWGMCWIDGDRHPDNECLRCNSDLDPWNWTPVEDGTPCGDGGICEGGECIE